MRFLEHLPMLTTVALTLLLTLVLPQIVRRLRPPGVVGWILAGILFGPHLSGVLHVEGEFVTIFAEIGTLMLMFFAGFEIDFREFNRTKRQSAIFGALTFSLPFLAGAAVALTAGYGWNTCLVVGAILASTYAAGLADLQGCRADGPRGRGRGSGATVFTDTLSIPVLAICPADPSRRLLGHALVRRDRRLSGRRPGRDVRAVGAAGRRRPGGGPGSLRRQEHHQSAPHRPGDCEHHYRPGGGDVVGWPAAGRPTGGGDEWPAACGAQDNARRLGGSMGPLHCRVVPDMESP
jgi:hypothetical protein